MAQKRHARRAQPDWSGAHEDLFDDAQPAEPRAGRPPVCSAIPVAATDDWPEIVPITEVDLRAMESRWRAVRAWESCSSDPTIAIVEQKEGFVLPMLIAMDPRKHDVQRTPVRPIVSPTNLHLLEPLIRELSRQVVQREPTDGPRGMSAAPPCRRH